MTELLRCPFCNSENIDPKGWASTDRSGPACDDCGGSADTVELWNSRPAQLMPTITDELVERALAENVDLIQGFTYDDHHSIRDFRQDYTKGVEIWRCPTRSHGTFQKRLAHEKLKAQLIAAFSALSSTDNSGAK